MAMSMSVGIVTTLFAPEPSAKEQRVQTVKNAFWQRTKAAIVEPFTLFFIASGGLLCLYWCSLLPIGFRMW